MFSPNSEVGRDGALRRPRRRAQRQATERVNSVTKVSNDSLRPLNAGGDSAARCPYHFRSEPTFEFGLKGSKGEREREGIPPFPLSRPLPFDGAVLLC